jgi:hypothetical protein
MKMKFLFLIFVTIIVLSLTFDNCDGKSIAKRDNLKVKFKFLNENLLFQTVLKDSTKITKKKLLIATKVTKKVNADHNQKGKGKILTKKQEAKIQKSKKKAPPVLDKDDQKLFLV